LEVLPVLPVLPLLLVPLPVSELAVELLLVQLKTPSISLLPPWLVRASFLRVVQELEMSPVLEASKAPWIC
jgi:hypothetical protein